MNPESFENVFKPTHANDSWSLLNPRLPPTEAQAARSLLETAGQRPGHFYLLSSGTTGGSGAWKWISLSRTAMLASGDAVNRHLESNHRDVWLHELPDFHVAGLAIWARAHLSGARVVKSGAAWSAAGFLARASETRATLASLVPTQLHDLVLAKARPPSHVRVILVGGGTLHPVLRARACQLGWSLLPTYAMTECASSAAIPELSSAAQSEPAPFGILPHFEARVSAESRLLLKGESLFTDYTVADSNGRATRVDPKSEGWFETQDRVCLDGRRLEFLGRDQDALKIGGELTFLSRLQAALEDAAMQLGYSLALTLVDLPDARLGQAVHLAVESAESKPCSATEANHLEAVVQRYHQQVLPFEQVRGVHPVKSFPRTDLGKIKRSELRDLLLARQINPD